MSDLKILGIAGSLPKGSFNRGLVRVARDVAPNDVEIEDFDLAGVPLYDGDVDLQGRPDTVIELMTRIADADAVLFATPAYNGTYSGVMKNAVDWASRRFDRPVFAEKPVAVMGAGGVVGTARAQAALRELLMGQGCYVLPRPRVHVIIGANEFDADGDVLDEDARQSIAGLVEALAAWTRRLRLD